MLSFCLLFVNQNNKRKIDHEESFIRVKTMAADRHNKLDESNSLHQFFRDVDDEESWIK